MAYWKYAVRRQLARAVPGDEDDAGEGFARSPADWPGVPERADEKAWAADRKLLRDEHRRLCDLIRAFPVRQLDNQPPGAKKWTCAQLMFGIATHDAYHTGQIQLLKRLWKQRHR